MNSTAYTCKLANTLSELSTLQLKLSPVKYNRQSINNSFFKMHSIFVTMHEHHTSDAKKPTKITVQIKITFT
uniref:Uncharacterized protein n=1 Tax=Anguilla anguilla TaxID=7936 RepID=A0A0E9WC59_ANGAN